MPAEYLLLSPSAEPRFKISFCILGLDMDDAIIPYVHYFMNANIDGRKLLLLTHSDLERLNIVKLGHQELILEAVDLLRNLVGIK